MPDLVSFRRKAASLFHDAPKEKWDSGSAEVHQLDAPLADRVADNVRRHVNQIQAMSERQGGYP
jgi:hypothetical protein